MKVSFGSFFASPKAKSDKVAKGASDFQGVKNQEVEDTFLKAAASKCTNKTQRPYTNGCRQ